VLQSVRPNFAPSNQSPPPIKRSRTIESAFLTPQKVGPNQQRRSGGSNNNDDDGDSDVEIIGGRMEGNQQQQQGPSRPTESGSGEGRTDWIQMQLQNIQRQLGQNTVRNYKKTCSFNKLR
jgi:hypothetical protein